jgi:hypothetical protein
MELKQKATKFAKTGAESARRMGYNWLAETPSLPSVNSSAFVTKRMELKQKAAKFAKSGGEDRLNGIQLACRNTFVTFAFFCKLFCIRHQTYGI